MGRLEPAGMGPPSKGGRICQGRVSEPSGWFRWSQAAPGILILAPNPWGFAVTLRGLKARPGKDGNAASRGGGGRVEFGASC